MAGEITKVNGMDIMQKQLNKLKRNGFNRVNPALSNPSFRRSPDFDERQI